MPYKSPAIPRRKHVIRHGMCPSGISVYFCLLQKQITPPAHKNATHTNVGLTACREGHSASSHTQMF